jgi:hypothetical protein
MYRQINVYEFYNLYNEEAYILDFSDNQLHINFSNKVSHENYLEILTDFTPDSYNNIIIIGIKDHLLDSDEIRKFKNLYFFPENRITDLYKTFPLLFNGDLRTYPSIITQLFPKNIFLGSIKTVTKDFLLFNKIEKIINMTFNKLNLENEYNFGIEDEDYVDISDILDQTFSIIDNNDNVLIVCEKGRSRSVSVVLYYYLKKYSLNLEDGLNNLRKSRSICNPIDGFKRQIRNKLEIN